MLHSDFNHDNSQIHSETLATQALQPTHLEHYTPLLSTDWVLASQLADTLRMSTVTEDDQNMGISSPDPSQRRRRRGSSVAQSMLQLAGIRYFPIFTTFMHVNIAVSEFSAIQARCENKNHLDTLTQGSPSLAKPASLVDSCYVTQRGRCARCPPACEQCRQLPRVQGSPATVFVWDHAQALHCLVHARGSGA